MRWRVGAQYEPLWGGRAERGLIRTLKTLPPATSLELRLCHRAAVNPGCGDNHVLSPEEPAEVSVVSGGPQHARV